MIRLVIYNYSGIRIIATRPEPGKYCNYADVAIMRTEAKTVNLPLEAF